MFGWALVGIGGVAGGSQYGYRKEHGVGSSGRDRSGFKRLHYSPRYQGKVSSFLHKSLFVYLATMDTSLQTFATVQLWSKWNWAFSVLYESLSSSQDELWM